MREGKRVSSDSARPKMEVSHSIFGSVFQKFLASGSRCRARRLTMPTPRKRARSSKPAPGSIRELYSKKYISQLVISSDGESDDEPRVAASTTTPAARGRVTDYYSPVNLIAQLQQDALRDLKSDICAELDDVRDSRVEASPINNGDVTNTLRSTLQRWVNRDKASRATDHFYYRLGNKYSKPEFSAQNLQARDKAVVEAVTQLLQEGLQLEILFAVLEREDTYRIDPPPSYLIGALLDSNGHALVHDVPVKDSNWLQSHLPPLNLRNPTHFEIALVLIPLDSVADFLIRGTEEAPVQLTSTYCLERRELQVIVDYYTKAVAAPRGERLVPIFRDVCAKAWSLNQTAGLAIFPHAVVERILKEILRARDFGFFEQAAAKVGGRVPSSFFRWVAGEIQAGRLAAKDIEKGYV